jgi:predicted nucleic acid-binding protein
MIRIYLDTWLLRGLVSNKPSESSYCRSLVSKLKNGYDVVVPQIVLGEVFAVIVRDNQDPNKVYLKLKELCNELYNITKPNECLPPPTEDIINCMQRLRAREANVRDTDLMVVAHALIDPESERLLTEDKNILNSSEIQTMESQLRAEEKRVKQLRIIDRLRY